MHLLRVSISLAIFCSTFFVKTDAQCQQQSNCFLPRCFCSHKQFPRLATEDIPQMVYFAFDDAVTGIVAKHYDRIFTSARRNPNGCPIKMSLYVSHNYTDYRLVNKYSNQGHEVAVHSVNHGRVDNGDILRKEALMQKQALVRLAGVPEREIIGWRSPYLLSAGDDQPRVLKQLGFKYDISLTYTRTSLQDDRMIWPLTLDYGWPHRCQIPECPKKSHPGFWEVPVISMMDKDNIFSCAYVDGCHTPPETEEDAYRYLWNNFNSYYQRSRAPFGFNMHAAWFQYPKYDRVRAMNTFLDKILQLKDVYVVTVKQVLEWMENPTPISNISNLKSWSCKQSRYNGTNPSPKNLGPKPWKNRESLDFQNPNETPGFNQNKNTRLGVDHRFKKKDLRWRNSTNRDSKPNTRPKLEALREIKPENQWNKPEKPKNNLNYSNRKQVDRFTTLSTQTPEFSAISNGIKKVNDHRPSSTQPTWHPGIDSFNVITEISINPNILISKPTSRFQNSQLWQHVQRYGPEEHTSVSNLTEGMDLPVHAPTTLQPHSGLSIQDLEEPGLRCQQNATCFLPMCFCATTDIPSVPVHERPQFVLLSLDGPINYWLFSKYESIFTNRVNPNGCPIRGTIFVSGRSNSSLVKRLHDRGLEISLRGLGDKPYESIAKIRQGIIKQVRSLTSSPNGIQMRDIKGWRSPFLKPVGDEQYKTLKDHGFLYDSTLISERIYNRKKGLFPFTLDYGWPEPCKQEPCPQNNYPGLWEIPVSVLEDTKNGRSCRYADGCQQSVLTAEETEEFLWRNFLKHYQSNRVPFRINLTEKWFHWFNYQNNRGLINFIDRVLRLGNVYFVSNTDAIKWIQYPVESYKISFFC